MKTTTRLCFLICLTILSAVVLAKSPFLLGSESDKNYSLPSPYKITAYAMHEVDSVSGVKTVLYKYKFENNSKLPVGQITLGKAPFDTENSDDYYLGFQALDENGKRPLIPIKIYAPNNWIGQVGSVMESNEYVVIWKINPSNSSSIYGIQPSKYIDTFSIRMPKADKKFTSTYISAFPDYRPALVDSFDKVPPTIAIALTSTSPVNRIGWLEINVVANVKDAYDPYPEALLTKITSNQTITAADVDAVYNEETKKFWLKKAPNRSYTIEYTGMDASGNKAITTSTIWAAQ
jgi:hypothetical protein